MMTMMIMMVTIIAFKGTATSYSVSQDGSAQTIVRAATLRKKLQFKLSISHSHGILTLGQPVQALILLSWHLAW